MCLISHVLVMVHVALIVLMALVGWAGRCELSGSGVGKRAGTLVVGGGSGRSEWGVGCVRVVAADAHSKTRVCHTKSKCS